MNKLGRVRETLSLLFLALLWACGSSVVPATTTGPANQDAGVGYSFNKDALSNQDASLQDAGAALADALKSDGAGGDDGGLLDGGSGSDSATSLDGTILADADAEQDAAEQDSGSGASCGDGKCEGPETCALCPQDCGSCPAECGDGKCDPKTETCASCAKDCGACPVLCGDGKCEGNENCTTCPLDCGKCPVGCGNGKCDGGESCKTCPKDCGNCPDYCGDNKCSSPKETCTNCPGDCGKCPIVCGDGKCDMPQESYSTCPKDCPKPGVCDPLTSNGCKADEQCYPAGEKPACAKFGALGEGTACELNTQCSKGFLCVGKKCGRICDETGANALVACPGKALCDQLVYNDKKPVGYNLGVCVALDACNATTDVGCPSDEICIVGSKGKICVAQGKIQKGGACKYMNDCVKGLICIGDPGSCKQKCDTKGGSPKCATGTCGMVTITEKGKPPVAGPDNLGVCN